MTSTTEWAQVESSMQDMAPSSDLFDGDILGDELMDIYNAAVVGGADGDAMNEMSSLFRPHLETDGETHRDTFDTSHNGDAVAADDGFGVFRPSTSFNDLSILLQTPASSSTPDAAPPSVGTAPNQPPPMAALASSATIASSQSLPTGGKRKACDVTGIPVPKRRSSSAGRKNTSVSNKRKSTVGIPTATKNKNDTPNPLKGAPIPASIESSPNAAKSYLTKNVAPVQPVPVGISPQPSVVTPAAAPPTAAPKPTLSEASTQLQQQTVIPTQVASATTSEADFQNVAQAAVSNLIMNLAHVKTNVPETVDAIDGNVDTSSDHVKALTGSNWVSVCSSIGGGCAGSCAEDASATSHSSSDKLNNRARRQNLTPDERARQNRDRNREHARNTRLRKKAYVEELKRTLTALVAQRDAAELEKRHACQRELEQREVRFRVTEEFLKLRGRNEANPARWAAILEENFRLTLPITDFRDMVHSGDSNQKLEQVLTGVSEIMTDSNMCAAFLQGLGKGQSDIELVYNCDRKNFYMDNCTAMLEFTATTHGAVEQGVISELCMKGNVRAKFSPASNKLISVVMTFDTGIIMSQFNQIMKSLNRHDVDADAAAAQVAASEADALLDSLQMPHIDPSIPGKINVVPPSSGSTTDSSICEKEETSDSSDKEEGDGPTGSGKCTRRVLRRKD